MSIAPALQRYLTAENIQYDVVPYDLRAYRRGMSDFGGLFAKAIVLRRDAGHMFAVLPASHHLRISDLRNQLGDDVEMAKEAEIDPLFPDLRARGSSAPRSLLCAASRRRRQHRGVAGNLYGGGRSRDASPPTSLRLFAQIGGYDLRIGANFIRQAGNEETAADQDRDAIGQCEHCRHVVLCEYHRQLPFEPE